MRVVVLDGMVVMVIGVEMMELIEKVNLVGKV